MLKAAILSIGLLLIGCNFVNESNQKFGDQHFKTAISLIELHKIRTGAYPDALADLKFTGEWDAIALASVDYKRLGSGYELNLTKGWVSAPKLSYPPEFWKGLGVVKTNVKGKD